MKVKFSTVYPHQNSTKLQQRFSFFSITPMYLVRKIIYLYACSVQWVQENYMKEAQVFEYKYLHNNNNNNNKLLDVEIKTGIAQPPPHHHQQQRNCKEAQTPEKWKTLLRQNLHLLQKIVLGFKVLCTYTF